MQTLETELAAAIQAVLARARFGQSTSAEMAKVAAASSRMPLANLARAERHIRGALDLHSRHATPFRLTFRRQAAASPPAWLLLCSGDGHLREQALRSLDEPAPNAFLYAIALRRLNDWVAQVREAALAGLPTITRKTDAASVADGLCAVLPHWLSWGRAEDTALRTLLDEVCQGAVLAALTERLMTAPSGPMATILSQVSSATGFGPAALDALARSAVQPAVRATAYRYLLEGRARWVTGTQWTWLDTHKSRGNWSPVWRERQLDADGAYPETLQRAAADRSAMVRRLACEFLIRYPLKLGSAARPLAQRLANDPCASVAERGRFALTQQAAP